MKALDFVTTTAVECATPSQFRNLKPDFTRAQFGRNRRAHTESRCNYCGFRITTSGSDRFDNEEQEHASTCRGSGPE
jgi:hypothetical protein